MGRENGEKRTRQGYHLLSVDGTKSNIEARPCDEVVVRLRSPAAAEVVLLAEFIFCTPHLVDGGGSGFLFVSSEKKKKTHEKDCVCVCISTRPEVEVA